MADWYYADGGNRNGPVSDEAFGELARTGVVNDSTLVWNVTLSEWTPYGSVRTDLPVVAAAAPVSAEFAFCSNCGRRVTSADLVSIAGRQVCGSCKPALLQQLREGTGAMGGTAIYAGFWIRTVAILIDYLLITTVNVAITIAALGFAAVAGDPSAGVAAVAISYLSGVALAIGYDGYFLVNKGATPGKLLLGLRVIRVSGAPITWGLAVGRYFAKMLSAMIFGIGYFIAGWDPEKRTLHDRICDTRVIKG